MVHELFVPTVSQTNAGDIRPYVLFKSKLRDNLQSFTPPGRPLLHQGILLMLYLYRLPQLQLRLCVSVMVS